MTEVVVNGLIEGGKATAGPPFGPVLGPLGVNTAKVVEEINEYVNKLRYIILFIAPPFILMIKERRVMNQ